MAKGFKFHKLVREDKVHNYIDTRFDQLSKSWFQFQNQWISSAYKPFQDYEKYLIFLYLVKKTISFFSENLIKYDYATYFKGKQFEIANFNIIEISKSLDISKETARRKILELVKENIIKREKKKLTVINIIDRNQFSYHRPEKSIKYVSKFLSDFFNIIEKEKLIEQKIDQKTLEKYPDCFISTPTLVDENNNLTQNASAFPEVSSIKEIIKIDGDICCQSALGAVMFCRTDELKKLGMFDEKYFIFYEDDDLCKRVRLIKKSVIQIHNVKAVHQHGQGKSVKNSLKRLFIVNYNMTFSELYYFYKNNHKLL